VPRPQASFAVADAAATSLPANTADALVCIDAVQLVPDASALLRETARVLRPGGQAVITTWERSTGEPAGLPSSFAIADTGALAETAGLHILVREERHDWLDQQQAFYQQVIAADSDSAEPALRCSLGRAGHAPPYAFARRLLLVASARSSGPATQPRAKAAKVAAGLAGGRVPRACRYTPRTRWSPRTSSRHSKWFCVSV
jgi:SAM-dependent methyltransferase